MPKLIVDANAMEMLKLRMSGFQIHMGPDGRMLEPGVVDLLDDHPSRDPWQPLNQRTKQAVLGTEACREILFCAKRLEEQVSRRRTMKNMTLSIWNLMKSVKSLSSSLNDEEWASARRAWRPEAQQIYRAATKRVNKAVEKGPVTRIRHQLVAHLDPEIFQNAPALKWNDILEALGDALVVFILVLDHPSRAFSWIREVGASVDRSQVFVETMFEYPVCVRWITDNDGRIIDIDTIVLAADPRFEIQGPLLAAVDLYNALVRSTGTRLPFIVKSKPVEISGDAPEAPPAERPWSKKIRLLMLSEPIGEGRPGRRGRS